ncbi:MAG: O-antigen polymerase [Thomasclavelia ramosa]|nr:O-antigen polymerase [Thomasclavelia ramosa]
MILLVLVFFIALTVVQVLKKKWNISIYLLLIYTLSILFSIFLSNISPKYMNMYPKLIPSILFCIFIYLCIKPFFIHEPTIEGFKDKKVEKKFILVGYVVSALLIIGIILVLPKIRYTFSYGIGNVREDMFKGLFDFSESGATMIGTRILLWLGNLCYPIIIMFFYSLAFLKRNFILKMMLFISSFAEIILGFFVGGRTNIIYYALFFLYALIMFYKYLTKNKKFYIMLVSMLTLFIILLYLFVVTTSRFGATENGTTNSLISYIGQPYINFCYFFSEFNWHPYTFERIFPLTSSVLFGEFDMYAFRTLLEANTGLNIGVFYTFLGDIFVDLGVFGLSAFVFIYNRLGTRIIQKKSNNYNISSLFNFSILYIIPLHGIFYYSAYQKYVIFSFILTVLLGWYIIGKVKFGRKMQIKFYR